MLPALLGVAALTWALDKSNLSSIQLTQPDGDKITVKNKFNPVELGYDQQLAKNLSWGWDRTRRIGDVSDNNPLPYVNPQGGGENTNVTNMKQAVLPDQLKRFRQLVHQRENIEEYWRFDNYLGDVFPNDMATHRLSSIANRY
jgi:hypothetical protein